MWRGRLGWWVLYHRKYFIAMNGLIEEGILEEFVQCAEGYIDEFFDAKH
ncbi:hypothetical protein BURPS668_A1922 [Burkholderia pseudomallei 668]|nr:hypothetical protein BURPS668_A1922 [Burkholderia pseudomallei 668]